MEEPVSKRTRHKPKRKHIVHDCTCGPHCQCGDDCKCSNSEDFLQYQSLLDKGVQWKKDGDFALFLRLDKIPSKDVIEKMVARFEIHR